MQDLRARLQPIICKHSLHLSHYGSFQSKMCFSPNLWRLGIPQPSVRQTHPARETDLAINDHEFAVRAMSCAKEPHRPRRRIISHEFSASLKERFEMRLSQF